MNILLSNDDGYRAEGIVQLHRALSGLEGVTVFVIAPEHNQSAQSNALTLKAPVYVHTSDEARTHGFRYTTGTPADGVHIALTGLLDVKPDLVVSGINNGANMGDDTLYSGTVGAAMEGYLFGIPAVAFSQTEPGWRHLDAAVQVAVEVVEKLRAHLAATASSAAAASACLLNVNIPPLARSLMQGLRLTRLGKRHAAEPVITQTNPRGETMYWIGAAGAAKDQGEGTDFHATRSGFVSITPLQVDLTDQNALALWRGAWQ